jgi:N-acylglucosamine-6-phosphate 2-epimerase
MPSHNNALFHKQLKGGLIISVQQDESSPLNNPEMIAAFAQAVAVPGVVGLRLNGAENIRAVKSVINLPIIGIHKQYDPNGRVWITPTFDRAEQLAKAGCDIIALDATDRPRPSGATIEEFIAHIHERLGLPVMADIATFDEGLAAARAGVDIVATTLSGYTRKPFADPFDPPDLALVANLYHALGDELFLIAEGRYSSPQLAKQAFEAGAHGVVVGSAITRPDLIASWFVQGLTFGSKKQFTGSKDD